MSQTLATVLPYSVQVRFPGKMCDLLQNPDAVSYPQFYVKTVDYKSLDDAVIGLSGFSGQKVFYDTCPAIYTLSGFNLSGSSQPPANQDNLDNLAKRTADDYYLWLTQGFDQVYQGVVGISGSPVLGNLTVDYTPENCATRIKTRPYYGEHEQLLHWDSQAAPCACKSVLWQEAYGPPGKCVGGNMTLTVWLLGFINGTILKRYQRTDTLS